MGASGPRWRVTAAVAAVVLGLAPTSMSVDADAGGPDGSRARAAERPLITTAADLVAFSPNGDHRRDRGRIWFSLTRAASVHVVVRNQAGLVRSRARLGHLSGGRHVWTWDGRNVNGIVTGDGFYDLTLRAVTATRTQSARTRALVDTVRPQGQLITTRATAYPRASMVEDHVLLVWQVDGWSAWAEEMGGDVSQQPVWSRLEIRAPSGDIVWRRTTRHRYTPVFDWYARREGGRALPVGRYRARLVVSDAAGNRRRASRDLRVSDAQLVEEVWSATLAAGLSGRYAPYFGGCNGCYDSCRPVDSDRFPEGLSFRPCSGPFTYQWPTTDYFGSDVPFVEAPVDTYRVTAAGGPTTPGSIDVGQVGPSMIGPGDGRATTPWTAVELTTDPFLPSRDRPVTWTFTTFPPNSYDVATFTVEYRHYVPAASGHAPRSGAGSRAALSPRRR